MTLLVACAVKALRLSAVSAAICALLALLPAGALAQVGTIGGVLPPVIPGPGNGSLYPTPIPPQSGISGMHGVPGFHPTPGVHGHGHGHFRRGLNGGFIWVEDYVPVVVEEAAQEAPAAPPPPAPPPEPRKPYVLGHVYDSLPGGCLKLLQDGASYFQCSGRWYREVGDEQYKAVRMP